MNRNTALSVGFAAIMVLSMVAMPLGVGLTSANPGGMVGVPGENVGPPEHAQNDNDNAGGPGGGNAGGPPDHAGPPGDKEIGPPSHANIPEHAAAWDIQASDHAGDLGVEIGATASGQVAFILSDDVNHGEREVAVDADQLAESVGFEPDTAFGAHSSGDSWTSEIRYEGDKAVFEVPKFSENTVTFSGEVRLTGDAAGDGTRYQYEVDNASAVDGFAIDTTGVLNTGTDTISLSDGSNALDAQVDNGTTSGTLTASVPDSEETKSGSFTTGTTVSSVGDTVSADFSTNDVEVKYVRAYVDDSNEGDNTFDVIFDGQNSGSSNTGFGQVTGSPESDPYTNPSVTFEMTESAGNTVTFNSVEIDIVADSGDASYTVDGTTYNLADGESATVEIANDSVIDVSHPDVSPSGGLNYTATTATRDPVVEVNGHTTSYDGTLADGETVSLSPDESWIEEGTNTVNISTNSPSTGPESLTGVDYTHEVGGVGQSTSVGATTWGEKISSTHIYPEDTANPEITAAFNDRVVSVESAEYRINGGSWEPAADAVYDGTTLTATMPDVVADDEVEVRANGSKVRAVTGSFTVTDPTTPGNPLTSTIRADEVGDSGQLSVGIEGTEHGDKAHYVAESDWSHDSQMLYTPDGKATLVMPNAEADREADLRTAPINAGPASGPVEIAGVAGDQDTPEFEVVHDTDGDVDYTFLDAEDGQYELYSVTNDEQIATGEASSPVTITAEGDLSGQTLVIRPWSPDTEAGAAPMEDTGGIGIPLDFGGPVVPLALLGALGVGGLVYRRQFIDPDPNTGRSTGATVGSSPTSRIPGVGLISRLYGGIAGVLGRIPLSGLVGRAGRGAVRVGKAVTLPLWRLVKHLGGWGVDTGGDGARTVGGWLAARLQRPAIGLLAVAGGTMAAIRAGLISPAEEVRLLLAAVAALIGAAVALRAVGLLTWRYYGVVAGVTFLIAGEAISPGSILPSIGAGIEEVFPIFALVAAYLIIRRVRGSGSDDGSGGDGSSDEATIVIEGDTTSSPASGPTEGDD